MILYDFFMDAKKRDEKDNMLKHLFTISSQEVKRQNTHSFMHFTQ